MQYHRQQQQQMQYQQRQQRIALQQQQQQQQYYNYNMNPQMQTPMHGGTKQRVITQNDYVQTPGSRYTTTRTPGGNDNTMIGQIKKTLEDRNVQIGIGIIGACAVGYLVYRYLKQNKEEMGVEQYLENPPRTPPREISWMSVDRVNTFPRRRPISYYRDMAPQ